tara:strand:- start:626 stop:1081 length:456 start_codon:yes stop_codon:yes gene_type:complete
MVVVDDEIRVSKDFLNHLNGFLNFLGKKIATVSSSLVCYAGKDRIDKRAIFTACKLSLNLELTMFILDHDQASEIPSARAKTLIKDNHNGSIAADASPALAKVLSYIAREFVEQAEQECVDDNRKTILHRDLLKVVEKDDALRYLGQHWKW